MRSVYLPLYVFLQRVYTNKYYLHDRIISRREVVWAHKTSLIPPFFIEVPVPKHFDVTFR
jgi:hypothetical protein